MEMPRASGPGHFCYSLSMAIDYNTIRYLETVGGSLRVHYKDGQKVDAYPDGIGRYMPRKGPVPPPPEEPPPPPPPPPQGLWSHPLPGAIITSPWGPRSFDFHYGIDLSSTTAPVGNPVLAVTALRITVARENGTGNASAGTYVKGHSFDGEYTWTYAHGAQGTLNVVDGQEVPAGYQLMLEGATGNAFGTHCHLECHPGVQFDPWAPPWGNPVDPVPVLNSKGIYL